MKMKLKKEKKEIEAEAEKAASEQWSCDAAMGFWKAIERQQ